jgi:hypothetical protein
MLLTTVGFACGRNLGTATEAVLRLLRTRVPMGMTFVLFGLRLPVKSNQHEPQ